MRVSGGVRLARPSSVGYLDSTLVVFNVGSILVMLGTWRKYTAGNPGHAVKVGILLLVCPTGLYLASLWPILPTWPSLVVLIIVTIILSGAALGQIMSIRRQPDTR